MNIVSLLPSATEIVCALGMSHALKGRSHECDFPEFVTSLPAVTMASYTEKSDSIYTDRTIRELLKKGLSPFEVDTDRLKQLEPDVILTQDHCEVCAISFDQLKSAARDFIENADTRIVSLSPADLAGIYDSIREVGDVLYCKKYVALLIQEIQERLDIIRNSVQAETRKRVCTIEWLSPLMTAGNWVPELIDIAGGEDVLGTPGEHSPWIDPSVISNKDPDVIFVMPCGYDIKSTAGEAGLLNEIPGWSNLKAAKSGEVYLLDGNRYFNRPGPSVYDSTRILAEILHPQIFKSLYKNHGWIPLHELPEFDSQPNHS